MIGFVLLLLNESHTTFRAVDTPDYRAHVTANAERMEGPDGHSYRDDVVEVAVTSVEV